MVSPTTGRSPRLAFWLFVALALVPCRSHGRLILIAHRGASANAPENTLGAFDRAKTVADFVEYDVWPTRDGQLVVLHDATVDRTTNGHGAVSDLTLAQIRQLDAGSWFGPASAGERVPTADEAIAAIQTEAAPFMERKGGTVDQFVALLNRQPLRPEGVVMSFEYEFVVALKRAKPDVQVGWIGTGPLTPSQITRAAAAGVTHFVWSAADIDARLVVSIHQAGGLVFGWTVNDLGIVATLSEAGVDGIITDRSAEFATAPAFASPMGGDRVEPPNHTVIRMGRWGMLAAAAPAHVARRVEWRRANDPKVINTGSSLRINAHDPQSYGHYVASWVNNGETVSCDHFVSAGATDNQLVNISVRLTVGPGEATGIVGFVVKSARAPRFLLRAIGPSLVAYGIADPVLAPSLTLFRRGTVIDSDTVGARTVATAADFVRNGAFPLAPASGDVAILRNLPAGAYAAHLSTTGDGGVGLIEVYQDHTEANWAEGAVINLSLRGRAIPHSPLIGGFVVPDGSSQTVLVRGIGPSLAKFGIAEPLSDPSVRIFDSSHAIVAENDDWWADGDSAEIQQATAEVGAFRIPAGRDAALLVTLSPGAYTAVLAGPSGDRTGVGLLEIYAVESDDSVPAPLGVKRPARSTDDEVEAQGRDR